MALVVFHFIFVAYFALDIPIADDYSNLLMSTVTASEADGAAEVLQLVFQQHTLHITAFNKFIALGYYGLNNDINFRHLIFAGNGLLVATALLLVASIGSLPYRRLIVAVCLLMLVHPASGVTSLWAITSLSIRPRCLSWCCCWAVSPRLPWVTACW
jgi:hypothetical protein